MWLYIFTEQRSPLYSVQCMTDIDLFSLGYYCCLYIEQIHIVVTLSCKMISPRW